MRCPKCADKTDRVATGKGKYDYIVACYGCSWQVCIRQLAAWIKRWKS